METLSIAGTELGKAHPQVFELLPAVEATLCAGPPPGQEEEEEDSCGGQRAAQPWGPWGRSCRRTHGGQHLDGAGKGRWGPQGLPEPSFHGPFGLWLWQRVLQPRQSPLEEQKSSARKDVLLGK